MFSKMLFQHVGVMLLIFSDARTALLEQHLPVYNYLHGTERALCTVMQDIKEGWHQWYVGYGREQLQPTAAPGFARQYYFFNYTWSRQQRSHKVRHACIWARLLILNKSAYNIVTNYN